MMAENKIFGSAEFYKKALLIAIPVMLQQLIQSLVSMIDNFMVSGLGDVSMSGVNVAGQVLFVFMIFVNTICMSGGIFLTQFYGAKDEKGMQQAFRFKLVLGLAAFIPYFFVCIVTGCCESRRGYEDGSLYGCDDNDIRDAAAAVWFGTPDRYRTGGIISLHQADRSCQGGDIPLLVEEGTVA